MVRNRASGKEEAHKICETRWQRLIGLKASRQDVYDWTCVEPLQDSIPELKELG